MRLLIVEDERFVRERLAEGINWASGEIDFVDAVANGKEAVAILQKEHIDIIITDIHMPDMNGLELARHVKNVYPHMKVIILTGYDDFEYARESIDYGVYKYLVKPVMNEQLWETVQEAKALHEQELREKHNLSVLEQRWKEHLPRLQEIFFKNWLNGHYSQWEIERWSLELNVHTAGKRMWPVIVDMDPIPEGSGRFSPHDRPLVQFSLFTVARDVFNAMDCVTLQEDDGMTAVIFFAPENEPEEQWQAQVHHQIEVLLSTIKDCLRLTASAGIGGSVTDKLLLPRAYMQSRMALQERVTLGNGITIHFRNKDLIQDSWTLMGDLEKELEMAVETGNGEVLRETAGRMMEAGFSAGKPVAEAKEMLLRMMCLLARIVHSHGWTLRDTLGDDYDDFERFHELLTKEQISEWLQRMSERISRTIAKRRQSGTQITVGEMVRFIQGRLHDEELSLYLVAEQLHVNYSYLSRLFKKAAGVSFSDYVLRLRMEKAKELLANGEKVYDTAEQVGFRHVNYFSKAFAKYWGVKPSDIHKSVQEK